jgi:hypothetical protein
LKSIDKYVNYVDEQLGNIASNQFKQYLRDHILSVAGELDYNLTMHYKKHSEKSLSATRPEERHRNNVENQPRYVFLMSEDVNIDLFLSAVIDKHHRHEITGHQRTVIPSSTLFFELIEDGDKLLVEGFFND